MSERARELRKIISRSYGPPEGEDIAAHDAMIAEILALFNPARLERPALPPPLPRTMTALHEEALRQMARIMPGSPLWDALEEIDALRLALAEEGRERGKLDRIVELCQRPEYDASILGMILSICDEGLPTNAETRGLLASPVDAVPAEET